MPYDDFTRDFGAMEGCNRRNKQQDLEIEEHQKSAECTGVDCLKCKELKGRRAADAPNLP